MCIMGFSYWSFGVLAFTKIIRGQNQTEPWIDSSKIKSVYRINEWLNRNVSLFLYYLIKIILGQIFNDNNKQNLFLRLFLIFNTKSVSWLVCVSLKWYIDFRIWFFSNLVKNTKSSSKNIQKNKSFDILFVKYITTTNIYDFKRKN